MNEQLKQSLMAQGIPEQAAAEMAKLDPGTYSAAAKCYADAVSGQGDAAFDRAGAVEKLGALPNSDRTALAAMSDDELKSLMSKNGFASDPKPAPDAQPNTPKDPPFAQGGTNNHNAGGKRFADDPPAKKDDDDKKFASILSTQRQFTQDMAEFKAWRKDQERKAAASAKASQDKAISLLCDQADGFCAQLVKERKATPGESKAYAARLKLLAKNQQPDEVVTFSADGVEKKGTSFEALMAELKSLQPIPARFFSANGIAAGGDTLADTQKGRPERVNRIMGAFEEGRIALSKRQKAATN